MEPPVILSNEIAIRIPKTVIATMSSKLLAASIISGIPFFAPYFFSIKIIRLGTRTAGDTAAKQNPSAKHRVHGREKSHLDIIAAVIDSVTYGAIVKITMIIPVPSNSSSNPPLIRMMQRQI